MIHYVNDGRCEECSAHDIPVASFDIDPYLDEDGEDSSNTAWLCEACLRTALRFFDNRSDTQKAVAEAENQNPLT